MKRYLFLAVLLTTAITAFTQKKYSAFAVGYPNYYGRHYGVAMDMPTLAEAQKKALDDCRATEGKGCRIVLQYAGKGFISYQRYDVLDGDYFMWAAGKTKAEAEARAEELVKRDLRTPSKMIKETFTNQTANTAYQPIFYGHDQNTDGIITRSEAVAFSPDGRLLAVGNGGGYFGGGGYIKFWRMPDQEFVDQIKVNDGKPVYRVAFSPDGKMIAAGSENAVQLYDVNTRSLIRTIPNTLGEPSGLTFTADGKSVAVSSIGENKPVMLWKISNGELMQIFGGQPMGAYSVSISSDNKMLISSGVRGDVLIFDPATGQQIKQFKATSKGTGVISPDNKLFAIAGNGGDMHTRVYDLATGSQIIDLPGHGTFTYGLSFYNSNDKLLTVGYNRTMKLWGLRSGTELIGASDNLFYNVAVSPKGIVAVVGEGGLQLWEMNNASFELVKIKY